MTTDIDVLTENSAPEDPASVGLAGLAGVVAAGTSLAVGEFFAGLVGPLPSLVTGVATFVIDNVPPSIKDLAIQLFGTADKIALGVGIVLVSLVLGVWVGRRALTAPPAGVTAFAAFGLLGGLAAARTGQVDLIPALVNGALAAGSGIAVLRGLLSQLLAGSETDVGRRAFLVRAGSVTVFGVFAALFGVNLASRARDTSAQTDAIVIPTGDSAPTPAAAASLDVEGISPLVTPNSSFYRIDTAFVVPNVDVTDWSMRVTGMVDQEVELNYNDLLEMDMVERYITIACVSNEVGGKLVGNAYWSGVPLSDVLNRAGVQEGAEQLVGRSVDKFTVGFPVEAAFDGREALVAVAMNGEPLPVEHGFPARLVVSGLYGYVSATKWLAELHLTTWDAFDPYWIPRGWAREAPIKTMARIDTPQGRVKTGTRAIAGVAWAPTRGISRVEVRVDDGPWQDAELAASLSDNSWRQWALPWEPTEGRHVIEARATDGFGDTQTADIARPAPNGASGYHKVTVDV